MLAAYRALVDDMTLRAWTAEATTLSVVHMISEYTAADLGHLPVLFVHILAHFELFLEALLPSLSEASSATE